MNKKEWIYVICAVVICLAAGLFYYLPRGNSDAGMAAVITIDGQVCYWLPLEQVSEETVYDLQETTGKPVRFEVYDHQIRFIQVDCPDHLCEQMGWCRTTGDRAVCLPNRVTLQIYDLAEYTPPSSAQRLDNGFV